MLRRQSSRFTRPERQVIDMFCDYLTFKLATPRQRDRSKQADMPSSDWPLILFCPILPKRDTARFKGCSWLRILPDFSLYSRGRNRRNSTRSMIAIPTTTTRELNIESTVGPRDLVLVEQAGHTGNALRVLEMCSSHAKYINNCDQNSPASWVICATVQPPEHCQVYLCRQNSIE